MEKEKKPEECKITVFRNLKVGDYFTFDRNGFHYDMMKFSLSTARNNTNGYISYISPTKKVKRKHV